MDEKRCRSFIFNLIDLIGFFYVVIAVYRFLNGYTLRYDNRYIVIGYYLVFKKTAGAISVVYAEEHYVSSV